MWINRFTKFVDGLARVYTPSSQPEARPPRLPRPLAGGANGLAEASHRKTKYRRLGGDHTRRATRSRFDRMEGLSGTDRFADDPFELGRQ